MNFKKMWNLSSPSDELYLKRAFKKLADSYKHSNTKRRKDMWKSMTLKKLLIITTILLGWHGTALAQLSTVNFEDLVLDIETCWNGSDNSSGFTSQRVEFNNNYNSAWGSWDGFSYSNLTDTEINGMAGQYNAIAGSGAAGSSTYAAGYVGWSDPPTATLPSPQSVSGVYVTNNNYTYYSILDGDAYAKKFGGESGDDADWFLLTITGKSDNGTVRGSVEFYLADYRFEDNAKDYILDEWTWVDLTSLGPVKSLEFSLTSSDTGDWGMNTPAYFCLDNLNEPCICGNGNIEYCDECDDGNTEDGDGCSSSCQIEPPRVDENSGDTGNSGGSGGSDSPANRKPVIDKVYTEQIDGYTVLFTVEARDPDGNIAAYQWQFSDSVLVTTPSANVSHTFDAPDFYDIFLTVKDNKGGETSQELIVHVVESNDIELPAPAPEEAPGCINDADCDDGNFCNGIEQCIDGECEAATPPCNENEICMEDDQQCWTEETIEVSSLIETLKRPWLMPKRCVWLPLYSEDAKLFDPQHSEFTVSGPNGNDTGIILNSGKLIKVFKDYILVPICIKKDADQGTWLLKIETVSETTNMTITTTIAIE